MEFLLYMHTFHRTMSRSRVLTILQEPLHGSSAASFLALSLPLHPLPTPTPTLSLSLSQFSCVTSPATGVRQILRVPTNIRISKSEQKSVPMTKQITIQNGNSEKAHDNKCVQLTHFRPIGAVGPTATRISATVSRHQYALALDLSVTFSACLSRSPSLSRALSLSLDRAHRTTHRTRAVHRLRRVPVRSQFVRVMLQRTSRVAAMHRARHKTVRPTTDCSVLRDCW